MAQPAEGQNCPTGSRSCTDQEDHPRLRYMEPVLCHIYIAVLAAQQPRRLADLMGYQSLIARVSKMYKWPAWVIYDHNFRQEAVGNPDQPWAKAEPSLYTQCFTGQELVSENWCSRCQGLDHSSTDCPYQAMKCPWTSMAGGAEGTPRSRRSEQQPCLKYNRY